MKLSQILFSQGFGTRKQCASLIASGVVTIDGATCANAEQAFATDGLTFTVLGEAWPFHAMAYLMLNKPAGFECSHKPKHWPSVYSLLPAPLRDRPTKSAVSGVQAIGRLDQDTTGLLILSDDGQLIHRMASPKHHVPKVYEVTTAREIRHEQIAQLIDGVVLNDDPLPVKAKACERVDSTHLRLTLTEGKYHQVKRMVAAVGNHVESLHRSQIGGLRLPADLAEGAWRWLSAEELAAASINT
ncbi:MAG: pseudouridine synthase [Betaproteobacteria bacterium]|nr:MAG: pseudouridine synthase [Betaproteobacteria bacterium]